MLAWKDYTLQPNRDPQIDAVIDTEGWYTTPIPRKELKAFVRRDDGKAARHFGLWALLLGVSAGCVILVWNSWWAVPALLIYGLVYNSADSKWHELSHGTPFTSHRINEALYILVSFMTLREPVRWRWSHARHHTHTIVVGQDPEIASPRPPHIFLSVLGLWYIRGLWEEVKMVLAISAGRVPPAVRAYVPNERFDAMVWSSRAFVLFIMAIVLTCLVTGSILPAMLVGLPRLYGSFLHYLCAFTQHAGLDEDVLDHRLNARTMLLNPVFAFLYTNMNYHIEHHMFPMVPFYHLPALHERIKDDCPPPCDGLVAAYREIIQTLWRQRSDPSHYAYRVLPTGSGPAHGVHFRGAPGSAA